MSVSQQTLNSRQAAQALLDGYVIAYPTEAVWGLGCDPFNQQAVQALLKIKQRPIEKGLILVAANIEQLQPYLSPLSDDDRAKISSAENPTTFIVPVKKGALPSWVTGSHNSVAIRVSRHTAVKTLCLSFGGPIISTSANPSGCQAAREIVQLRRYFGAALPVYRGRIGSQQRPSVIQNLRTGQILRA